MECGAQKAAADKKKKHDDEKVKSMGVLEKEYITFGGAGEEGSRQPI